MGGVQMSTRAIERRDGAKSRVTKSRDGAGQEEMRHYTHRMR